MSYHVSRIGRQLMGCNPMVGPLDLGCTVHPDKCSPTCRPRNMDMERHEELVACRRIDTRCQFFEALVQNPNRRREPRQKCFHSFLIDNSMVVGRMTLALEGFRAIINRDVFHSTNKQRSVASNGQLGRLTRLFLQGAAEVVSHFARGPARQSGFSRERKRC